VQLLGGRADAGASKRGSLWRSHDFMLLWSGETVSTIGSSMSFFVFPLVGYTITGSTTLAALTSSAYALGGLVMRLPAGVLVDRWSRRRVLVGSNLLGGLLYLSLGVAGVLHALTMAHLVVVALCSGLVSCFFTPAETAALREVVPADQMPAALSQNQARRHVASLVGPPLGGALLALRGWAPFAVDGLTYLVSAAGLTRLRAPLAAPAGGPEEGGLRGVLRGTREGLRFIVGQGFLRAILAWACIVNFAVNMLFLVVNLKLLRAGVHPATIGIIDTMGAVSGLAGSLVAPALVRRLPTGRLTILAGLVLTLAVLPIAFTDTPLVVGALFALALFLNPASNASIGAYRVAITPDHLQGRSMAAMQFSVTLFTPFTGVLGGAALAALGGRDAILAAAALIMLSVVPLLASSEVRTLATPDRWVLPGEPAGTLEA
jgi:MFS family permease